MMVAKSQKSKKITSLILTAVFLCSSVISLFIPSVSRAAYDPNSISSQNDRTVLVALETCIQHINFSDSATGDDVNKSNLSGIAYYVDDYNDIINDGSVPVGYELDSDDGNARCTGLSLTRAMRVINKNPHWFFNQIYNLNHPSSNDDDTLLYPARGDIGTADSSYDFGERLAAKLKRLTPDNAGISNKEKQRRVAGAFWLCNEQVPDGDVAERTSNKIGGKVYQYREGKNGDNKFSVGLDLTSDGKYTCYTLLHWGNEAWLANALKDNPQGSSTGSGAGAPTDDGDAGGGSSCQGGALGWILCPMIDLLTKTTTFAANMVDSLLQFRVLASEADSGDETIRTAWQGLLSIANICLVLAFLVIIFSQSTSLGLSNYGIKRMLPRLILAAILINLSFYICAFLVDISNIVGSSIMGFLTGPGTIGNAFKTSMDESGGFAQALVGGVAIVAIIFFFLLPVLLAILLVLLLLIARLVILGVLIVVSPLAFAAWLLPNTESYFKKWWDLFTKLLFIYPVIMAIFGASLLFSKLGKDLAPGENATIGNLISLAILAIPLFVLPKILMSTNSMMGQVGGLGQKMNKAINAKIGEGTQKRIQGYGKFAASAGGRKIASRFSGTSPGGEPSKLSRRVSRVGRTAREGVLNARAFDRNVVEAAEQRKQQKQAELAERAHRMASATKAGPGGETKPTATAEALQQFGGSRYADYVAAQRDKAFDEKVSQIQAKMKIEDQSIDAIADAMKSALVSGDHETVRAAFNQLSSMGGGGKAAVGNVLQTTTFSPDMDATVNNAVDANYSGNVEKEGFIAKGRASGGKFEGDISGLSAEQLAGQTLKSLQRDGAGVDAKTAKAVVESDILRAKAASPDALRMLEEIAKKAPPS